HRALVSQFHDAPTLVLAGGGALDVHGERVRALGRISEEDKWHGLAGALAAVAPSKFESLSLLALEAFAVGTPLIANAESSGLEALSARALQYARAFRWPKVVAAYRAEIARIQKGAS